MPLQRSTDRNAVEHWLSLDLKQRFDSVLREPVTSELAKLLDSCPTAR